jgi:recombination DNA repair RAD52 pathway protein
LENGQIMARKKCKSPAVERAPKRAASQALERAVDNVGQASSLFPSENENPRQARRLSDG